MSMLSWPKAVKAWNGAAAWKDDLYALPKKGGEFYDEVRELMGHKKPATPAPVAAVLPPEVAPAPVVAPAPRAKFSFGSNIIDSRSCIETIIPELSRVEIAPVKRGHVA